MQILILTASLPYPPQQGGAIRVLGLLKGLHASGHEITLVSFTDMPVTVTTAATQELTQWCREVISVPAPTRTRLNRLQTLLFSAQADIEKRLYSLHMEHTLRQIIHARHYDLVQLEGIEVAAYYACIQRAQPHLPVIYDAFNAEAALQQVIATVDRANPRRFLAGVYSTIQARRIAAFERTLCCNVNGVIAVSEDDAALLRPLRHDQRVYVVPNGIDAAQPVAHQPLALKPNALVFTGKMDYRPNVDAMVWFVAEILPRIQAHVETHLYIVGQKPSKAIQSLGNHPDVTVTGWVADVEPYLQAARVYVAPLRMGSGTRLKLLGAMTSGCPIVATPLAASGLTEGAGDCLHIAQEAHTFADAVVHLLQDAAERERLGQAAERYVRQNYDWSVIVPRLIYVYEAMNLGQRTP